MTFDEQKDDLTDKIDFIVCLGGDGTLLVPVLQNLFIRRRYKRQNNLEWKSLASLSMLLNICAQDQELTLGMSN
jgi:hypothetical protein